MSEKHRGGARPGAGRPKYFRDRDQITIRLEKTVLDKLKEKYGKGLNRKLNDVLNNFLFEASSKTPSVSENEAQKKFLNSLREIAGEFGKDYQWYLDEILQEYEFKNG